jgi:hypothetical protein
MIGMPRFPLENSARVQPHEKRLYYKLLTVIKQLTRGKIGAFVLADGRVCRIGLVMATL